MDFSIVGEQNRANPKTVYSEFEQTVMGDIAMWAIQNSIIIENLETASHQFWEEMLD